jgi:hypothetical protein
MAHGLLFKPWAPYPLMGRRTSKSAAETCANPRKGEGNCSRNLSARVGIKSGS